MFLEPCIHLRFCKEHALFVIPRVFQYDHSFVCLGVSGEHFRGRPLDGFAFAERFSDNKIVLLLSSRRLGDAYSVRRVLITESGLQKAGIPSRVFDKSTHGAFEDPIFSRQRVRNSRIIPSLATSQMGEPPQELGQNPGSLDVAEPRRCHAPRPIPEQNA